MNGKLDYRLTLDESDYVAGFRRSNQVLADWRRHTREGNRDSQAFGGGLAGMAKGAAAGYAAFKLLEAGYRGARAAYLQFAQTEKLERALAATMGSADLARARLVTLRQVARQPGLGLEEAALGDIRLQAVGISAMRAERILRQVGNAIAAAGGGKTELNSVTTAISQMATKGTVFAEEINQIAERMPQIRKAMQNAFGTADTEALQRMGVSSDEFIDAIMDQLERLPRAGGGAANAIENLDDSWKNLKSTIGRGLAPLITPGIEGLERLASSAADALDGVSPEEQQRLAGEAARHAQAQAAASREKAAAEKEALRALEAANREASRQVEMSRLAAEYAATKAEREKDARDAAMRQGTSATRRIIELTTPEPQLIERDLQAAMAKARSMASLINGQARDWSGRNFTPRDLANAADEERDLTKKAAMRELLAKIVELQVRQRDLAKQAAEEQAREAEKAAEKAATQQKSAAQFEREGRILAARAAGNEKMVEALERQARIEDLKLDLMERQGLAADEAERKARERVALEERAANGRPRRGVMDARDSAISRWERMSDRDKRRYGSFRGFLDRDVTTRGAITYQARLASRAAERATSQQNGTGKGKETSKLESYAAQQKNALESIDKRLADLGLAGT